jgi:hypothetical protein
MDFHEISFHKIQYEEHATSDHPNLVPEATSLNNLLTNEIS